MLEKEFVPYEQALALKELGFNESCLAHLIGFGDGTIENGKYVINYQQVFYPNDFIESDDKAEELGLHPFGICGVPLYQQAFRWFRKKYNIDAWVQPFVAQSKKNIPYLPDESYGYFIFKDGVFVCDKVDLLEPEEAELACLIKLIEIVKNK